MKKCPSCEKLHSLDGDYCENCRKNSETVFLSDKKQDETVLLSKEGQDETVLLSDINQEEAPHSDHREPFGG